jgi:magnesium-transporting ATPase (P-type)
MLAKREVPQEVYDEWALRRTAAEQSEEFRQEKIDAVNSEMERDLVLVGSTAIEDRLQENVAEVIKFMRVAGIKVWVLTGDKKETAENIGVSCGLLDAEQVKFELVATDVEELKKEMKTVKDDLDLKPADCSHKLALVVAGDTLTIIQDNEEFKANFSKICDQMDVVMACRVSPK